MNVYKYKPRGTVIRSADENHICRTSKSVFWIGIKKTQRAWWFVFRKLKNRLVTAAANLGPVTSFRNSYVEDFYICLSSFLEENYFNRLICYTKFMIDLSYSHETMNYKWQTYTSLSHQILSAISKIAESNCTGANDMCHRV